MTRRLFWLLPLLLVTACAEGGSENRPASEVKLEANHSFLGIFAVRSFTFPVPSNAGGGSDLSMSLGNDSIYRVRDSQATLAEGSYSLARNGAFSILLPGTSRQASVRYSGAYGLEGQTGIFALVDRFASSSAPDVGILFGAVVPAGGATLDLTGNWHVFSQHLLFRSGASAQAENVGRAVIGTATVATNGALTGTGIESTNQQTTLALAGTATSLADARATLTLRYPFGATTDERVFSCAASARVVLGIDSRSSTGRIGTLGMVRRRADAAQIALMAGDYQICMHTIFLTPSNAGTDAAYGTLTISTTGGVRLVAVGANGQQFTYTGNINPGDQGAFRLVMDGFNIPNVGPWTWSGAIDSEYKTMILQAADQRFPSARPELNFCIALRNVRPAN